MKLEHDFFHANSSVARGGCSPPHWPAKCAKFLVLLRPIFGEKMKTDPPKEIGRRSCEADVVIRPEKAFEFPNLAEKSVSISRINRPKSDKPCDSDSRTIKIWVKFVCSFLTLSKKSPLFKILATRLHASNLSEDQKKGLSKN